MIVLALLVTDDCICLVQIELKVFDSLDFLKFLQFLAFLSIGKQRNN